MLFINDLWFKHLMLAIEEEQEEEERKEQEEKQEVVEEEVLDLISKSNSRWIFVYVFLCSVRLTYNLI